MRALAGRPVTQARDVFDLDTLQRGGFARAAQVQQWIEPEKLEAARQSLDSLSFDDFSGQVTEFLDDDYRREYGNTDAWRAMKEQVQRLLDTP